MKADFGAVRSYIGLSLCACNFDTFSQMESVRKDIECCFGILKLRFKIMAHPVQYHSRVSKEVRHVSRMHACI